MDHKQFRAKQRANRVGMTLLALAGITVVGVLIARLF
jgi:hypothetical protein